MLQIDHIYEFLYQELFKDFDFFHFKNGVVNNIQLSYEDIIYLLTTEQPKKYSFMTKNPFIKEFI
jgi:hypothetical protein